jgi:hypothetical protein
VSSITGPASKVTVEGFAPYRMVLQQALTNDHANGPEKMMAPRPKASASFPIIGTNHQCVDIAFKQRPKRTWNESKA